MEKYRDKKFIQRLEMLRGERNKAQFARDCDIRQTTMLGYLSGDSQPNLQAIRKIAQANNVTCGWLLGDEVPQGGQSVIGNGNISAGGQISGGAATTGGQISQASAQAQLEHVLTADETELINGIRELGGKLLIEKFLGELEKIRQFIKGE